jgi:hypothetical protein
MTSELNRIDTFVDRMIHAGETDMATLREATMAEFEQVSVEVLCQRIAASLIFHAPTPRCGHGVPIYGQDCDACDAGNAESDLWR